MHQAVLFFSVEALTAEPASHQRPRRTSSWDGLPPDHFECIHIDEVARLQCRGALRVKMLSGQGTRVEITQEDHEDGSIAVDGTVRTRLFDGIREEECTGEQ